MKWSVYSIRSISNPRRFYVGITENLEKRLEEHDSGKCPHTSKYIPWQLEVAVVFINEEKAHAFEKYLKSASGRAFAKKHF